MGKYQPHYAVTSSAQNVENQRYRLPFTFADYGSYRYSYRLVGTTQQGEQKIQSPWFSLTVRLPWLQVGGAFLLLLLLINWIAAATAKLRGQIQIESTGTPPQYEPITVRPRKCFDSREIRVVDMGSAGFKICAKRKFIFIKRLCVALLSGAATFEHERMGIGKTVCVPVRGTYQLKIVHDLGHTIIVTITLRI